LILIDPITDFLGKIDMYKDDQVRPLLNPLARIASRHDLAIVYILHLNKKTDQAARYLGLGSVAFRNVSKSTLLVAHSADMPGVRIMAQEKKNLTPEQRTVMFLLKPVARSPFPGIEWGEQLPDAVDIDDLLNHKTSKQQKAVQLLRQWLGDGSRPANEIRERAQRNGISEATLRLAKETVGVVSRKRGAQGGWWWRLPDAEGANLS
jgi:RecA-family ATPase